MNKEAIKEIIGSLVTLGGLAVIVFLMLAM